MPSSDVVRASRRRRVETSFVVETAICILLVVIFIAMFVNSLDWEIEAGLFPRIVSGFGVISVLAYLCQLVWQRRKGGAVTERRILDIPWAKVGGDQAAVKKQAFGVIAWAVAFWIGVVLVGFHVAAPLYLYSQLVIYGRVKRWVAVLGAGAGLILLDIIYDRLAETTWNDPLLFDLVKSLFSN